VQCMYKVVHTLHFLLSQICGGLCQTRKTFFFSATKKLLTPNNLIFRQSNQS
jgi:hypothetical protein